MLKRGGDETTPTPDADDGQGPLSFGTDMDSANYRNAPNAISAAADTIQNAISNAASVGENGLSGGANNVEVYEVGQTTRKLAGFHCREFDEGRADVRDLQRPRVFSSDITPETNDREKTQRLDTFEPENPSVIRGVRKELLSS
ncbi:hypothetical protein TNCV_1142831 [Trichonephila clavipes]|nr:hypothetical protein TNCV_1142831 [Trichonephila clavipes]